MLDDLVQAAVEAYKEFYITDKAKDWPRFQEAHKDLDRKVGCLLGSIQKEARKQMFEGET